ncbi:hypothetical protein [Methylobacterium planeticum]|uniref:Anti-sigma factor NepR domain-containing protein n=1 Tax=Methylobacterium planeticum TaxID=2615211 RepID=A0A6N6MWL6_9HYPH|nr:hypothetical protein [Methylobacterium planeticum]KAB1076297.1 hypothetical protein F6X51_01805 [Methylobacterium planeticum]
MKTVTPDHAAKYSQSWVSDAALPETTRLAMIGDDLRDLYEPLTGETPPGRLADLARRVETTIARRRLAA